MKLRIYLASQSERRRRILTEAGFIFKVVKTRYREKLISHITPAELCVRHAIGKTRDAVVSKAARFVLGADTIVWCRGRMLGKPRTHQEAFQMLKLLMGRSHFVFTGVAIWDRKTDYLRASHAQSRVHMKKMTDLQVRTYLTQIGPLDKAGAYAVQMKPSIVKKIDGSYTNVMGLPIELVRKMVKEMNV